MSEYDKSGVAPDGSIDPLRRGIAMFMHLTPHGSREDADKLYRGLRDSVANIGGGGDNSGAGGKKDVPEDIDFPVKRRQAKMADVYKPKVQKTFKEGGLVRGAGCAQRGHGRGKMV